MPSPNSVAVGAIFIIRSCPDDGSPVVIVTLIALRPLIVAAATVDTVIAAPDVATVGAKAVVQAINSDW